MTVSVFFFIRATDKTPFLFLGGGDMDSPVLMLLGALVAVGTVTATIDPDLFISVEKESKAVVERLDERKRVEYDQICKLVKGCKKEGGRYVL